MLPHNHFTIAGPAISPVAVALLPEKSIRELGEWIVIATAAENSCISWLLFIGAKTPKMQS